MRMRRLPEFRLDSGVFAGQIVSHEPRTATGTHLTTRAPRPFALVLGLASAVLAPALACRAELPAKALAPIPPATVALMAAKNTTPAAPLVLRSYKKEAEIEVWKQNGDGRFVYVKTFPICRWSGQLGPKHHAGDRQTPEGFYPVAPRQMNPNSHYYLSFDTGFPNAYDRAHGASGSAVMVHGTCSSMGCFAMTDRAVGEIYAIARDALHGGQPAFQLQAYPFHMSARNMALYRNDPNIDFWRQLKEGSDRFESTGELLQTGVNGGRYSFAPSKDPAREEAAQAFHAAELAAASALVAAGSAAVRTTYADGGQNAIFAALLKKGTDLGTVSRPEALAYAGIDVTLVPARHHPRPTAKPPEVASAAAASIAAASIAVTPVAVAPIAEAPGAAVLAALPPGAPASVPQLAAALARLDTASTGSVKASWTPPAPPRGAAVLKAHVADRPVDAAALGPAPMHYALFKPPQVVALISGAMPMRLATWTY